MSKKYRALVERADTLGYEVHLVVGKPESFQAIIDQGARQATGDPGDFDRAIQTGHIALDLYAAEAEYDAAVAAALERYQPARDRFEAAYPPRPLTTWKELVDSPTWKELVDSLRASRAEAE